MAKNLLNYTDGFNPELVEDAFFDGRFEIPILKPLNLDKFVIPRVLVPFSKRNYIKNPKDAFVCTYEPDKNFTQLIRNPELLINDLRRFGGVIAPDNSLAADAPFLCQAANAYRRNAIAYVLQKYDIPVIANPRWCDERSYSTLTFPEPIAFLGNPKHNIVCIGSYGSIRGGERSYQFKKGLEAMLNYLEPKIVLVYGSMPDKIFKGFLSRAKFIRYDDWTTYCHKRKDCYGSPID